MVFQTCEIFFDSPSNTYSPGQTISGHVDFIFDSVKKIREILIKFKGECNTRWTETEFATNNEGNREHKTVTYTGHEEYFQIQYNLLKGPANGDVQLPPGKNSFPFSCALPPTLPSSFDEEFGHVRYTVRVTLDRLWKMSQDSEVAFTVVPPFVDLNLNPKTKEPVRREAEKTFCCWCCASGPLTLAVSLPMTGYAPGQKIPITVECDNASNVKVKLLCFILRKKLKYRSYEPRQKTKECNSILRQLSVGPIEAGGLHSSVQEFIVPQVPPKNLTDCGLIDLEYELAVETSVSGAHQDLKIKIPIVLGSKPPDTLRDDVASNQANPSVNNYGTTGWTQVLGPDGAPVQSNIPPQHMYNPYVTPNQINPAMYSDGTVWNQVIVTDGSTFQPNIAPYQAPYSNMPPVLLSQPVFGTIQDNGNAVYSQAQQNHVPVYPGHSYNPPQQ